jgi:hypothetical protein
MQVVQYNTKGEYTDPELYAEHDSTFSATYTAGNILSKSSTMIENPAGSATSVITSTGEVISVAGSMSDTMAGVAIISSSGTGSTSGSTSNSNGGNVTTRNKDAGKGVTVTNNDGENVPVYRAGDNFTIKPGEFKIDKETGLVTSEKGVSVNVDPNAIPTKHGDPNLVESLPDGLKIIARGKPVHNEIVPEYPMMQTEFQSKLNQIKTSPVK